jgi:hypothetical protein
VGPEGLKKWKAGLLLGSSHLTTGPKGLTDGMAVPVETG